MNESAQLLAQICCYQQHTKDTNMEEEKRRILSKTVF